MIYTIGHTKSYDEYLSTSDNPRKLGRCEYHIDCDGPYLGGIVWPDPNGARSFIEYNNLADFSVYQLEGSWDQDVYLPENEESYRLTSTQKILKKVEF